MQDFEELFAFEKILSDAAASGDAPTIAQPLDALKNAANFASNGWMPVIEAVPHCHLISKF
jgi:hypothetical protein